MKFKLSKKQYQFLLSLNDIDKFIAKSVSTNDDNVLFEVDDVSKFQDEIYFNVVDDGMDREGKVNDLGEKIYNIYDELLYQIENAI